MSGFVKPRIFCSKCLGFAKCRWNGISIPDKFVDSLKPYVDYVTTCPEVEIGLGVPRDPIRIVKNKDSFSLQQLNTGKDFTRAMDKFSCGFLDTIGDVDGFILKDRSPSCGMKDVKVYKDLNPGAAIEKTNGFFAKEVLKRFKHTPVETEGRLLNFNIREHFLTKIFVFAKFRKIKQNMKMKDLVGFHAENKFLLMACNQKELSLLGKITANHEHKKIETVFKNYQTHLSRALSKLPQYKSNINVIMHGLGYFSKKLSKQEKRFFLNSLEEYRREQVPLSVPVSLLRSYIIRFNEEYLMQQTFFNPYPNQLTVVRDSGKGRT